MIFIVDSYEWLWEYAMECKIVKKKKYFQLNFSHTDREGERINDDHEKRKSLMEYL